MRRARQQPLIFDPLPHIVAEQVVGPDARCHSSQLQLGRHDDPALTEAAEDRLVKIPGHFTRTRPKLAISGHHLEPDSRPPILRSSRFVSARGSNPATIVAVTTSRSRTPASHRTTPFAASTSLTLFIPVRSTTTESSGRA
jgi:hypothetical protein